MQKQLQRSSTNKVIGGVCAGIANYLNVDPTIVRVLTVLLGFAWGSGPLLYLILWAVMPVDNAPRGGNHFDATPRDQYRS